MHIRSLVRTRLAKCIREIFQKNPFEATFKNGDWNAQKDKNQNPKVKKGMSAKKPNQRDAPVKSKSKSSQRPTSRSKASIEPPIRSKKKWVKPNYK